LAHHARRARRKVRKKSASDFRNSTFHLLAALARTSSRPTVKASSRLGIRWPYTSSEIVTDEWPSRSINARGWAPCAINNAAHVWRRSWNLTCRPIPDASTAGLNRRHRQDVRLDGSARCRWPTWRP